MPLDVRQRDVPAEIRTVQGLGNPDYGDCFTIVTKGAAAHTPEEWARAVVEAIDPVARFLVWQVAAGLRLEPSPSPDRVAGWKIGARGENWIRFEASSWCLTAHAVLWVERDAVSLALFVRDDRFPARLIRSPITMLHRRAVPMLLRAAVRRLNHDRRQA